MKLADVRKLLQKLKSELERMLAWRGYRCEVCGRYRLLNPDGLCSVCAEEYRPAVNYPKVKALSGITAGAEYNGNRREAILHMKSYDVGTFGYFARCIKLPGEWQADVLVPVPLYSTDYIIRGFNQTDDLARGLSKLYGLPVNTRLLYKRKRTERQKHMSAAERRRNLQGAFVASPTCKGLRIVLVDDIVTTGSTLSVCAETLLAAGAEAVFAACATCVPFSTSGNSDKGE